MSCDTNWNAGKIAIIMVGLPASGKTFTARNLSRYLRWMGVCTKTFSVAQYRNRLIGPNLNADFFDPRNEGNLVKRTEIADSALNDMLDWFLGASNGQVGILDASNTQPARRLIIHSRLKENSISPVFLECVYDHPQAHDAAVCEHIRELRLTCPEYASVESETAVEDYRRRMDYYKPDYVYVGEAAGEREHLQFIKFVNGGERIETNRVAGYLPSRMLYYLMNLHHGSKRIFLFPLPNADSGPVDLAEYTRPVHDYLEMLSADESNPCPNNLANGPFSVWTETSLISDEIGHIFADHELLTKPQLRGRDPGKTEFMSLEEVQARWPEEYAAYLKNPYYFRFPRAESYHDLAIRLENVIMELERSKKDVLILADQSVLQCIYAYFTGVPYKEIPHVKIDSKNVLELAPKAYGIFERRIPLNITGEELQRVKSPFFLPFTDETPQS